MLADVERDVVALLRACDEKRPMQVHDGTSPGAPKGQRNGRYRHGRWTVAERAMKAEARIIRRGRLLPRSRRYSPLLMTDPT